MSAQDYRQQMATEFERYQSLTTDGQRTTFWNEVEAHSSTMSVEQRLQFQQAVREQIDNMLNRMESIAQLLVPDHQSVIE